jgi:hypothetical protein
LVEGKDKGERKKEKGFRRMAQGGRIKEKGFRHKAHGARWKENGFLKWEVGPVVVRWSGTMPGQACGLRPLRAVGSLYEPEAIGD